MGAFAKNNIASVFPNSPDNQIINTVSIHIAGIGDRITAFAEMADTVNNKTLAAIACRQAF